MRDDAVDDLMEELHKVPVDERYLQEAFSAVPWDKPVSVLVAGSSWWVCRYCIAMHGLRAAEIPSVPYVFPSELGARRHIELEHG